MAKKPTTQPATGSKRNAKNNSRRRTKAVRNTVNAKQTPEQAVTAILATPANLKKGARDNDPNWYFTNMELAQQAAELSFQSFIGNGPIYGEAKIPAVMTVELNPCPGCSYNFPKSVNGSWDFTPSPKDFNSGINLMSNKIYTLLSTYSGRTSNYAPQDIGIMLLSIAALTEWSEHIRRAFGVALTYNQRNRFVPTGILKAMHIDAEDMFANIANYRMRFNVALTRINQIPLLSNIGFIAKARELFQRIYIDDESSMAQIYLYQPYSTWVLDEETDDKGSMLVTTDLRTYAETWEYEDELYKFTCFLKVFEHQIDALLNSSTLNIIYADLINLASKVSLAFWKFDYLAENYVVLPEYDRNFLLQMHNLDIIGAPSAVNGGATGRTTFDFGGKQYYGTSHNDVFCEPDYNAVLYNPYFDYTLGADIIAPRVWDTLLVDMDSDTPDIVDRIEALRFKAAWGGITLDDDQDNSYATAYVLPDHYAVSAHVYYNTSDFEGDGGFETFGLNAFTATTNVSQLITLWRMVDALTKFDHHPFFYMVDTGAEQYPNNAVVQHIIGDLTFCTEIDYTYLSRLNRLVYTGLFEFRM